jgi:uncharacterized membrane protein
MENKELIIKAVEDDNLLSPNQKVIMKILISYDSTITADSLMGITGFPKQVIYLNLNKLSKADLVKKEKKRVFVYGINKSKLLEITEDYKKKIELTKFRL